ncbi:MAG: metal ABC transporter permease [Rubrivivax sp.]|jgi:zinc/manganese transport system permease protein|nr:metal ABC transporter permease [Rubrivivax sp.]
MDASWNPFAEFGFMQRALLGCLLLSASAPLVGVFLLLRRMSLTGDAMAHAILPGAALGYLASGLSLGAMTAGGLLAGMAVVLASGLVARSTALREDASLAAFYLLSLAAGVLIISSQGRNVDLLRVLFGSVLALDDATLLLLAVIAAVTAVALLLLYRPLVLECVDPAFLRSVSRLSPVAHYGFLMLLVLNLVAGFHALGTLLSVGMMILPAAAARLWVRELPGMLMLAGVLSAIGSTVGLVLSYRYELATGPAIVLSLGLVYVVSVLVAPRGLRWGSRAPARHLRA